MKKLLLLTTAIFFTICSIIVYMIFVEPQLLVTTHETLYIPNWNKKLNGLKIGVVSDPHIGHGFTDIKKLENIVEKVNDQKPDLIFLLGDFDAQSIEDSKISKKEISETLDDLDAKYGTVAILGNHDYKPPCVIKKILRQANIPLLEDESKYFSINGQTIRVVGFKDLWHSNPNPIKTIGKPPYKTPVIVLEHNPDLFPKIPQGTNLTLSGHTHGGEVCFPILGAPVVSSKYNQRYKKGYVVENNKHLYVSGGIGTSSAMRLFNPPEIVFLNLYSQTPKTKISNTKPHGGFKKNYMPYYQHIVNKLKNINIKKA